MTTYLLITSDKPTELTAFVGPEKPKPIDYSDWSEDDHRIAQMEEQTNGPDNRWRSYESAMHKAKASRLPVVNPGVVVRMIRDNFFTEVLPTPVKIELDTPVELEGWESEIVYHEKCDRWCGGVGCLPGSNILYTSNKQNCSGKVSSKAYRLKRSEPVKMDHSLDALKYSTFGIPNASPIEAKTQESQEDLFHELFGRLYDTLERGNGTMENIKKEFILTRRNP